MKATIALSKALPNISEDEKTCMCVRVLVTYLLSHSYIQLINYQGMHKRVQTSNVFSYVYL